jgi:D-sedoheptulose 7-phosphate isomerase
MALKHKLNVSNLIADSIAVKTRVLEQCPNDIEQCGVVLSEAIEKKGKVMFCGNGGSAADCQHLAAELVIRFRGNVNRPAIPAIALTVDPSIMTAGGNDIGFDNIFAREVEAYGQANDILVGVSTSGNSENVYRAMLEAKKMGIKTIGLLGCEGGKIAEVSDYKVVVPSDITARIQESHILIGHIWCQMIEEAIFPDFC